MQQLTSLDCSRIAQDLQIRKVQVEAVVQLLDEGNTIPFLARYRKERTGNLNEEVLRQIQSRVHSVRQLAERKTTILRTIENQGKLTEDLRKAILAAETTKRLEDLYLPYKPKKRSLAAAAKDKGLEPLALAIWYSDPAATNVDELAAGLLNPEKDLKTPDEVKLGVQHILAEMINETAEVRAAVRHLLWETGEIQSTKSDRVQAGQGLEFKGYFEFKESARQIPPHRILALNRGEKEGVLKVRLEWARERVQALAAEIWANHLLAVAGKMPPPPPRPAAAPASTYEPAAAPTESQAPQEAPASAENAAPDVDAAAAEAAPAVEAAPGPETVPLSAAMRPTEPSEPVVLHGELLSPASEFRSPHAEFLKAVLEDALQRLLLPALEREIRHELTDEAEAHGVMVFARNLRSLLLQPPLHGKHVLAIDPGFRTGCKIAALDAFGNILEHAVIYPFGGGKKARKGPPADRGAATPSSPPDAAADTPAASPVSAEAPPEPAPPTEAADASPAPEAPGSQQFTEAPAAPAPEGSEQAAPAEPPPEALAQESPSPALPDAPQVTPMLTLPDDAPAAGAQQPAAAADTPPEPAQAAPAVDRREEAKAQLRELVEKYQIAVIALGNGTGCRETEEIVTELIRDTLPDLAYVIVSEAGASVYSVSNVAREEFPTLDATSRSAVSIGRRLQDPLSELVKIDPQSIGVGLYQHDMGRKELKVTLEGVVESCVNQVGVDVNTASVPLLRYVSGLNQLVARELVDYRTQHGPFTSRDQLQQVPNLGPTRYVQAAGFLKIPAAPNPLDRTWIHPESYGVAEKLLGELGFAPSVLDDRASRDALTEKLRGTNVEGLAQKLEVGGPTLHDMIEALIRPGRDPREDLPPPIFKKGVLKLEDLKPEMELKGTVLNVVDFGAFVDIGLKDSGLVHISQMANRYIKSPYDLVAVNDVVTVWVLNVDPERHHVSLTMIKPGTERKPPERGQRPPRGQGQRPPRGPRQQPHDGPQAPSQQGSGPGAPQGDRREGRGPRDARSGPPRGRGGPPRGPRQPYQGVPQTPAASQPGAPAEGGPASAPPPPPPRKPRREPPKPKLSAGQLEGKVSLRTFSELSAFLRAKEAPPTPPAAEPPREAAAPAPAIAELTPAQEPAPAPPHDQAQPPLTLEVQQQPEPLGNPSAVEPQ